MKAFYFLLALLPLAIAKPKCECPLVNCLGDDAARCKCANEAAIACAARCPTKPRTRECPTPTATSTKPPAPTPTVCGTRGFVPCTFSQYCLSDPNYPFCVQLNGPACGGFAGIQCPQKDQVCVDDPRDICGGPGSADCIGTCVRLDGSSSA